MEDRILYRLQKQAFFLNKDKVLRLSLCFFVLTSDNAHKPDPKIDRAHFSFYIKRQS
jgi:hypothetical protein